MAVAGISFRLRFSLLPMKSRVLLQGLATIVVIWTVVFGAQFYFHQFRPTAAKLESVVNASGFADWSERKGEPVGEEAESRAMRIREVAVGMEQLDYSEGNRARALGLKNQFYGKLSPSERVLFVELILQRLDPLFALYDALPENRRERELAKALKSAKTEFTVEEGKRFDAIYDEETQAKIVEVGWRKAMKAKGPDEILEHLKLIEIAGEHMQWLRASNLNGRGPGE